MCSTRCFREIKIKNSIITKILCLISSLFMILKVGCFVDLYSHLLEVHIRGSLCFSALLTKVSDKRAGCVGKRSKHLWI